MWPTFIYSPHPGQILVENRRTGSTRRTEQGQGRSSNKVQAAGVQTADLMLLDSVAQTVSSHFMGPVWAPQLPSLVSSVINFKSRSYTCLSLSLSLFFSGTSGEDQALSEPFSRLSKRIEGLQHLTDVPISSCPTLIGLSFKESTGEWFQSIPRHKNLCKEMVCCEARGAASYPRGRRIDRQDPPPTLLSAPVAMEMEYACNKIILTLFVSAVRRTRNWLLCVYVWVCACAPADLSFCCTLCRVCSNNEWHGWSLSVYA